MEEKKARVIDKLLDKYILEVLDLEGNQKIIEAKLRGNVKAGKRSVLVGDIVLFEEVYDTYMITKILDRKNSLIRPPVANIDNLVITLSIKNPRPDYNLLDKELILCFANNINPVICLNKIDICDDKCENEINYLKNVYSNVCKDIIYTSAKENVGILNLKEILRNKISAFSGNSGVGKSSIVKNIMNDNNIVVGNIAKKTNRGRHTTKSVKLYKIMDNTYVVDTPGFSSYEIYNIEASDLKKYYPEFHNNNCDYDDCNHINESSSVCAVKRDVEKKVIDRSRYERYVYIYNKLKSEETYKWR